MIMRHGLVINLIIPVASLVIFNQSVDAQTELRRGILQSSQMAAYSEASNALSQGTLIELQDDPNFVGSFQEIVNAATTILDGYTIVNRGGYFPENAGIPREQQLTRAEVVYYVYLMETGNQLVLYRSPLENTSQYVIREASSTF